MSVVTSDVRDRLQTATRILLAIHGGEPEGWARAARRAVDLWDRPSVRVLGLVAVPSPPFTSLIPAGARLYRAARAAWEDAERARVQRVLEGLAPALPAAVEVVWVRVSYSDPGRVITEHAQRWAADVLVLAAPPAAGPWLGAVHDRVIRLARCPVLVTPVEG
jgi:nucleotide-binding universal stress UspA family protein